MSLKEGVVRGIKEAVIAGVSLISKEWAKRIGADGWVSDAIKCC